MDGENVENEQSFSGLNQRPFSGLNPSGSGPMEFDSYEELKDYIELKEKTEFIQLAVHDSRTIANAMKYGIMRPIKASLKYYRISYKCIHSGTRKSRSTGVRPNQKTYTKGCNFFLQLCASGDGQSLQVVNLVDQHNHEKNEEIFSLMPRQRQLDEPTKEKVKQMLRMGASKKLVQADLLQSGKKVTLKDLHNIAASCKEEDSLQKAETEVARISDTEEESLDEIYTDDSVIWEKESLAEYNDLKTVQDVELKPGCSRFPDSVAFNQSERDMDNARRNMDGTGPNPSGSGPMKFDSYEELKEYIELKEKTEFIQLAVHDSRTIENAMKYGIMRPIKASLKYYRISYKCIHSGTRKSRSTGVRPNQKTYTKGCNFFLQLCASGDGQSLQVVNFVDQHNHEQNKEIFSLMPRQRQLDEPTKEKVKQMLRMKASKKLIQANLLKSGKKVTLKDLHNIAASCKEEDSLQKASHNLMEKKVETEVAHVSDTEEEPEDEIYILILKKDSLGEYNDLKTVQDVELKPGCSRFSDSVAFNRSERDMDNARRNMDGTGLLETDKECLDSRKPLPVEHIELMPGCGSTDNEEDGPNESSFSIDTQEDDSHSEPIGVDPLAVGTENEDKMKQLTCPTCSKSFFHSKPLKVHMLRHAGAEPFPCPFCSKRFLTEQHLKIHSVLHTGEKPYSCTVCKKDFTQSSSLRNHMFIHMAEKSFSCKVCKEKFAQISSLKRHMKKHPDETPFPCSICSEKFSWHTHLKKHIMLKHTVEQQFKCTVCSKCFSYSSSLNNHMLKHKEECRIKCTYCTKSFFNQSSLKIHLFSHTGDSPFSCIYCKQTYSTPSSLKRHIRMIHSNETPSTCTICDKIFSKSVYLKRHIMFNHTEKRFPCTVCQKKFARSISLKAHMLTHSREYKCTMCTRSFHHLRNLETHLFKHTEKQRSKEKPTCKENPTSEINHYIQEIYTRENPISCKICGKKFLRLSHLKTHLEACEKVVF